MPLAPETKAKLRIFAIGINASIAMSIAVHCATIGPQADGFWAWAFAYFALAAIGVIAMTIVTVRHARKPEDDRLREAYWAQKLRSEKTPS